MNNSIRLPAWMSSHGQGSGNALAAPAIIILLLSMMILPLAGVRARCVFQF